MQKSIISATGSRDRGVKTANYRVVKKSVMPAVLIEMGFISNASDARLMAERPDLFARGIYDGLLAYYS